MENLPSNFHFKHEKHDITADKKMGADKTKNKKATDNKTKDNKSTHDSHAQITKKHIFVDPTTSTNISKSVTPKNAKKHEVAAGKRALNDLSNTLRFSGLSKESDFEKKEHAQREGKSLSASKGGPPSYLPPEWISEEDRPQVGSQPKEKMSEVEGQLSNKNLIGRNDEVSKKVDVKKSPLSKRQEIMNELKVNESNYSNNLKLTSTLISKIAELPHYQKLHEEKKELLKISTHYAHASELSAELNDKLLRKLPEKSDTIDNSRAEQIDILNLAKIYQSNGFKAYAKATEKAAIDYSSMKLKGAQKVFLNETPNLPRTKKDRDAVSSLENFASTAVQRMVQHQMIIKRLIENTPNGTKEYDELQKALEVVNSSIKKINSKVKVVS